MVDSFNEGNTKIGNYQVNGLTIQLINKLTSKRVNYSTSQPVHE